MIFERREGGWTKIKRLPNVYKTFPDTVSKQKRVLSVIDESSERFKVHTRRSFVYVHVHRCVFLNSPIIVLLHYFIDDALVYGKFIIRIFSRSYFRVLVITSLPCAVSNWSGNTFIANANIYTYFSLNTFNTKYQLFHWHRKEKQKKLQ